ncbi:GNAT family N-acetyltransferase [bacterium]|nr:GNAT family N-acetyltransferase [bacterium]
MTGRPDPEFPPERIELETLVLRRPMIEDVPAIYRGWTNADEGPRYLSWMPHASEDVTRDRFIRVVDANWRNGEGERPWMIERRTTGELVGAFASRVDGARVNVGYVLGRAFWNQGMMSEALMGVIEVALNSPEIWRVEATCHYKNLASKRVMEKAGMEFEGRLRRYAVYPQFSSLPANCLLYARVKEES